MQPKAGDLVRVIETDDSLIPVGSYGVIEGEINRAPPIPHTLSGEIFYEDYPDRISVLFNFVMPWWTTNGIVDASGGPQRLIKVSDLIPTREEKRQEFKYWGKRGIGAGLAEIKTETVRVWLVKLS